MGQAFATALGSELSLKLEIVGVQVGPVLVGGPGVEVFFGTLKGCLGFGRLLRGMFFLFE